MYLTQYEKIKQKSKANPSGEGEMNYKVAWGNLNDRYVHDPNFDEFTDIYIYIHSLNYVLQVCTIYCLSIIL